MNITDFQQLKPFIKNCGYFTHKEGLPTIEHNSSSRFGWLSLLALLGLLQTNSPTSRPFGFLNIFIGISCGISHLIIKDKMRRLKLEVKRFTIRDDGLVTTDYNNTEQFIAKDEIEGFEIVEKNEDLKHQSLILLKENQEETITLMKSFHDTEKVEEAYLAIANYISDLWEDQIQQ